MARAQRQWHMGGATHGFAATAAWLSHAVLGLTVLYAVVHTHRERCAHWWNSRALRRPCTPTAGVVVWLTWLLALGSGGLGPVLIATNDTVPDSTTARLVAAGSAVERTLWTLAWVPVLFVAHGKGYAMLLAWLGMPLVVAVQVALFELDVTAGAVYVPYAAWVIYLTVMSTLLFWANRVGPTPLRPLTHDVQTLSSHAATAAPVVASAQGDFDVPLQSIVVEDRPVASKARTAVPKRSASTIPLNRRKAVSAVPLKARRP